MVDEITWSIKFPDLGVIQINLNELTPSIAMALRNALLVSIYDGGDEEMERLSEVLQKLENMVEGEIEPEGITKRQKLLNHIKKIKTFLRYFPDGENFHFIKNKVN